ncbi:MAG TPA: RNA pseudouridine synthase [Octadecabacter sp.]|mgnify:CR=1 FL=1|nr:RNA pseudouridine synthase [Octadecabacter sp.]
MTEENKKTPTGDRIAKVLARAGVASRREAEKIIEAGRVQVNGVVITSPALNVTPRDRIVVDNKPLAEPEAPRIWLYHKPAGLVTTERDEKGRKTVFDAMPAEMPRVMSVGRLDIASEGLLLLTNDGELKRTMELPATGWLRRYRVRINGSLSEAKLDELRNGITVDGVQYAPVEVKFDRQQGANAWLTMGLREGKNREIRRLMEAMGVVVNRLLRISYGPFQLGTLKPGAVEEVKQRIVRDQMGLRETPKPTMVKRNTKGKRPPPKRGTNASAKPKPTGSTGKTSRR